MNLPETTITVNLYKLVQYDSYMNIGEAEFKGPIAMNIEEIFDKATEKLDSSFREYGVFIAIVSIDIDDIGNDETMIYLIHTDADGKILLAHAIRDLNKTMLIDAIIGSTPTVEFVTTYKDPIVREIIQALAPANSAFAWVPNIRDILEDEEVYKLKEIYMKLKEKS